MVEEWRRMRRRERKGENGQGKEEREQRTTDAEGGIDADVRASHIQVAQST